jgi:hypothetical protein
VSKSHDIELLRQFKRQHGEELRQRYGAHGIGIGRKRAAGKKIGTLALVFYVARKHDPEAPGVEAIPPTLTWRPAGVGQAVTFETDVVESEPAEFE